MPGFERFTPSRLSDRNGFVKETLGGKGSDRRQRAECGHTLTAVSHAFRTIAGPERDRTTIKDVR
jgi:hypothetical protein